MELSCASVGSTAPALALQLSTVEGRGEQGEDRGDSAEHPPTEALLLSLRGDKTRLGGAFCGDRRLVCSHTRQQCVTSRQWHTHRLHEAAYLGRKRAVLLLP
jgi:hypothetical protein